MHHWSASSEGVLFEKAALSLREFGVPCCHKPHGLSWMPHPSRKSLSDDVVQGLAIQLLIQRRTGAHACAAAFRRWSSRTAVALAVCRPLACTSVFVSCHCVMLNLTRLGVDRLASGKHRWIESAYDTTARKPGRPWPDGRRLQLGGVGQGRIPPCTLRVAALALTFRCVF